MLDGFINSDEDAEECALLFGERFNIEPQMLLSDPLALVEATARWHIRGDADIEALHWLSELVSYQRRDSDTIARAAAVVIETELLPCVDAFCSSSRIPVLPA